MGQAQAFALPRAKSMGDRCSNGPPYAFFLSQSAAQLRKSSHVPKPFPLFQRLEGRLRQSVPTSGVIPQHGRCGAACRVASSVPAQKSLFHPFASFVTLHSLDAIAMLFVTRKEKFFRLLVYCLIIRSFRILNRRGVPPPVSVEQGRRA